MAVTFPDNEEEDSKPTNNGLDAADGTAARLPYESRNVTTKFPDVPERLLIKCPQLEKLKDEAKLSDISKTVAINYSTYYECAVKNDAWIEWYQVQKRIFESIK